MCVCVFFVFTCVVYFFIMSSDLFREVLICVLCWLELCVWVCVFVGMCVCWREDERLQTSLMLLFLWPCWEGRTVLWPLHHHCHFMYCVYFRYFLIKENKSLCDSGHCVFLSACSLYQNCLTYCKMAAPLCWPHSEHYRNRLCSLFLL